MAWRGELDSAGFPVEYIDCYRRCWASVAEHDLTVSAQLVHQDWYQRGFLLDLSRGRRLVAESCQRPENCGRAWMGALAAIAYGQYLGREMGNKLLAAFLVETILSRQSFNNRQELARAWSQWCQQLIS